MDKRTRTISGGLQSLLNGNTPQTEERSEEEHIEAEQASGVEALTDSIEDAELRDALRTRRMRKRGRPRKDRPLAGREGDIYTRATFIVRREHLSKLKEISLRETLQIKEVLDAALSEALGRYEREHGTLTPKPRKGGDASRLFGNGQESKH